MMILVQRYTIRGHVARRRIAMGAVLTEAGMLLFVDTVAGLAAARARGRRGGRPRKLSLDKVGQLRTLAADRTNSVRGICRTLGISRATYYRARTGQTDLTG